MELEKQFDQRDLIYATGKQFPKGICLGLVIEWLISNSRYLDGNEGQFWSDMEASKKYKENTPLLGVGYAAKANQFHRAVSDPNNPKDEIDLTRELLAKEGIEFLKIVNGGYHSPFTSMTDVTKLFEADAKYKIIFLDGKDLNGKKWGHVIGVYKPISILGKSVYIFDPNVGKYVCDNPDDAFTALVDISTKVDYTGIVNYFTYLFE